MLPFFNISLITYIHSQYVTKMWPAIRKLYKNVLRLQRYSASAVFTYRTHSVILKVEQFCDSANKVPTYCTHSVIL